MTFSSDASCIISRKQWSYFWNVSVNEQYTGMDNSIIY